MACPRASPARQNPRISGEGRHHGVRKEDLLYSRISGEGRHHGVRKEDLLYSRRILRSVIWHANISRNTGGGKGQEAGEWLCWRFKVL